MLFVHGYNTGFDTAVYRATQIAHDSGYPGTPVLFSWASGGNDQAMSTTGKAPVRRATSWR